MTITIEPKEIAELFELLARRESAKEVIDNAFLRACGRVKSEFLADEVPREEPHGNFLVKSKNA